MAQRFTAAITGLFSATALAAEGRLRRAMRLFRSLLNRLDSFFDRSRPRNRLGSLRRLDIMDLPAIRAGCDLGIVIGHLVQKG